MVPPSISAIPTEAMSSDASRAVSASTPAIAAASSIVTGRPDVVIVRNAARRIASVGPGRRIKTLSEVVNPSLSRTS
jgi:hypothetical protein